MLQIPYQGVYSSINNALRDDNLANKLDYIMLQPSAYQLSKNSPGVTEQTRDTYFNNVVQTIQYGWLRYSCTNKEARKDFEGKVRNVCLDRQAYVGEAIPEQLVVGAQFEMSPQVDWCPEAVVEHRESENRLSRFIGKAPVTFYSGVRDDYKADTGIYPHHKITNDLYGGTRYEDSVHYPSTLAGCSEYEKDYFIESRLFPHN